MLGEANPETAQGAVAGNVGDLAAAVHAMLDDRADCVAVLVGRVARAARLIAGVAPAAVRGGVAAAPRVGGRAAAMVAQVDRFNRAAIKWQLIQEHARYSVKRLPAKLAQPRVAQG